MSIPCDTCRHCPKDYPLKDKSFTNGKNPDDSGLGLTQAWDWRGTCNQNHPTQLSWFRKPNDPLYYLCLHPVSNQINPTPIRMDGHVCPDYNNQLPYDGLRPTRFQKILNED